MKTLYIAWQDPQTRAWHTVGKLTKEKDVYCFVYTRGALTTPDFYLDRMMDLKKRYYSRDLFPLFSNRILNKSRSEYPDYLRWLALDRDNQNPMQVLARSGGKRATDELCIFPYPEKNDKGEHEIYFFSHGLRYLKDKEPLALKRIEQLKVGEHLKIRHEDNNEHDNFALILETHDPIKVGYCPRYLNRDLWEVLDKREISLFVERVNTDAPLQFRLLCKAVFTLPAGLELFSGREFEVLANDLAIAA